MELLLIIEDDPDVSDALASVLRDEGYRVVTAANGAEGLRRLRDGEAPCLILLDLMMPVMDGYRFRAEQRRDPALTGIPVLVLTAGMHDARIDEMSVAGELHKPIDLEVLLDAVAQHCVVRAH